MAVCVLKLAAAIKKDGGGGWEGGCGVVCLFGFLLGVFFVFFLSEEGTGEAVLKLEKMRALILQSSFNLPFSAQQNHIHSQIIHY